jgi:hypothetical protein
MVGQFSLEVNRKDEPAVRRRPLLPSSKPAEMRAFYSGTDTLASERAARIASPVEDTPAMHCMVARGITGFLYTCQTSWPKI